MADAMHKYTLYLQTQRTQMAEILSLDLPARTPAEAEKLILINPSTIVKPKYVARCKPLVNILMAAGYNDTVCIDHGNNLGTYHYIWKTATNDEISNLWQFIQNIDASIGPDDQHASSLKGEKCGAADCTICSPPPDLHQKYSHLYIRYLTLYQRVNIISHFMTYMCDKPRVLYCKTQSEKQILMRFLQFYEYTSGASIQDPMNKNAPRVITCKKTRVYTPCVKHVDMFNLQLE
ncbi:hypothetical protein KUTeg_016174 [Tegillarca granosa]|uniref:Uncharacterized protein n=1 Tax=Tegillarca granosa TaxID=220873 RepID=A0ABQ9EK32_TEGGR|nr:hypothetical protein KUTeg_016174 [Tegillarca granosa]